MELIALPIYNQATITPRRIAELYTYVQDVNDVLIVDDGSDDGIGDLIKTGEKLKYIRHESPLGYGGSFITVMEYAAKHDFERVYFLDISNENFTEPVALMREILDSGADIVNISRKQMKQKTDDYLIINPSEPVSQKINSVTGFCLSDVFSPFKGFAINSLKEMTLEEFDESLILQLWIQSAHYKKKVREVHCSKILDGTINDISILSHDPEYYLNFIQGELLLYPQN
ncbi:MAG: glycosyltransferase [Spirochaetes bacterium]|nr:glycosyltransferase [Spirochaetota bacterium]MBN2770275.1 glycosyltransferase [Spirochaetota bacterium]